MPIDLPDHSAPRSAAPSVARAGPASHALAAMHRGFARDYPTHWANLSRLTNLLILLNISLFFVSNLVTRQHYYYTIYSVALLGLVHVAMVLPTGLMPRLRFYLACLALEAAGGYLLVASVWYWIETSRGIVHLF